MSRRWVLDASPIILLAKAGRPDLLADCSDQLAVPEAVADEVRQAGKDDPARRWMESHGSVPATQKKQVRASSVQGGPLGSNREDSSRGRQACSAVLPG
jgi:predicted nucleic acid-binding protein